MPFGFFKKKKKEKKEKKKKEELKDYKKEKIKKKIPIERERKKELKTALGALILHSPHISEKATQLSQKKNQYVFKVFPKTTKQEIKKAIEEVYRVKVLKVRTIKIPRKPRRLGRTFGWKKGYKKAIVTLKEGQKIEILPR